MFFDLIVCLIAYILLPFGIIFFAKWLGVIR